jgi:D-inositol-3-phosphate glycosyltransferase
MRVEAAREPGWYDLVHSHYWLSGQVAWLAAERWDVPLVHSMHTMARVKNLALAEGDAPEPPARAIGEAQVVAAADRLVANTDEEGEQLVDLYDADPARVVTVPPGVDLDVFSPGSRPAARRALGVPQDAYLLLFVGRIQPLKGLDVAVRALAALQRPEARLVVVGGASGADGAGEVERIDKLVAELGVADQLRTVAPVPHHLLSTYYRAADVVLVPSRWESCPYAVLEAMVAGGSGAAIVASRVGGIPELVNDGAEALLAAVGDVGSHLDAVEKLLDSRALRHRLGAAARHRAETEFSPCAIAERSLELYRRVVESSPR